MKDMIGRDIAVGDFVAYYSKEMVRIPPEDVTMYLLKEGRL